MARRPPPPPTPSISANDRSAALQRLRALRDELSGFRVESLQDEEAPELISLETRIARALDKGFGERTVDRGRFSSAADLRFINMTMSTPFGPQESFGEYDRQETAKKIRQGISVLGTAIDALEQDLAEEGHSRAQERRTEPTARDVFIVHGHDHEALEAVRSLVQKLGLNPIVLKDAPNGGRTLIEKFEANSERAGFAIVLLTPDDIGGPKGATGGILKPRARQNVILELGYFYGALTRRNVCALIRGDVEIPSDFVGVVCEPFDDHGAWRTKVAKELRMAGYPVDLNDL